MSHASVNKLIILITILIFGLWVNPVFAADFHTSLHASYTLDQEGVTTVSHNLTLTNLFADRFAREYSLTVGSNRLKNITVYDQKGVQLSPKIETDDLRTKITVFFPSPIVGKGKTNLFTITYLDPDIAQKQGNVLQLAIPRLENSTSFDQYQVTLQTPIQFGPPHALYPTTYQLTQDPAFTKIIFTAADLKNQGISAVFGDRQLFNFQLSFNLENTNVTPLETQVAIPPDTAYQQVFYQSINPEPKIINLDNDGNWIATFYLEPKQKQRVILKGQFVTYLKPTVPVTQPTSPSNYISATKNWPAQDEAIKRLFAETQQPDSLYYQVLDTYTVNHPSSLSEVNRSSVTKIVDGHNSLTATEYVDLLISLFRSRQIPARALIGYPVSDSPLKPSGYYSELLHIWMEYYDQSSSTWKPIDPFWEKTTGGIDHFHTLDFNHLVFVTQGTNSDQPLPLGMNLGYQLTQSDLDLVYSQSLPPNQLSLSTNIEQSWLNQLNLSQNYRVIITNRSGFALYPSTYRLNLNHPPDNIDLATGRLTSSLLPFQSLNLPINFQSIKIPYGQTISTQFTIQNETVDLQISTPSSSPIITTLTLSLGLVAIVAVIAIKSWSLLVSRRSR